MLLHLAWRRNLDSFDMAVAANRLAARGAPLWWLGTVGPLHEPGDYICEVDEWAASRIADFGIVGERWDRGLPDGAVAIAHPRIALVAGKVSAYPNFAYFAMALARLGFDFDLVDGAAIAGGILGSYDLVVLPTGSAVWGLDAAEGVTGADAALREFLGGHGAAIGSGGGAFYLSAGRPGWTAVASVRPVYTHEFLSTGIGLVSVRLGADSIAFGCPPTLEMPYCHGPVYVELDRSTCAAAVFERLVMPGRLFLANPLDPAMFAAEMAGHSAILRAETRRGRAVLFSPNPEMGDLVRKYIAFDHYVAHYLPIAGEAAMADTMRRYRPLDAPSWRLILNAVHSLMLRQRPSGVAPGPPVPPQPPAPDVRLPAAIDAAAQLLPLGDDTPLASLARMLRDDLRERIGSVGPRLDTVEEAFAALNPPAPAIRFLWAGCEAAALAGLAVETGETVAERLVTVETALVLAEAWCHLAEGERHFRRIDGAG